MKNYSLEEKIRIIEEFKKNGGEITGTTIYQDCPIGRWAIQIRYQVKKRENREKSDINPTESQLERLEQLGILESQLEATIDEKIESMAEWIKKYPKATFVHIKGNGKVEDILKEYSSNDDEYEKLLEEYKKMQSYYDYARARKSRGKLTDEQLKTAKEANIRGVFGYSAVNIVVDVDGSSNNKAYANLVERIIRTSEKTGIFIYSSEMINEKIKELTAIEKSVIERRFDLSGEGLPRTLESIGQDFKLSREGIRQIELRALRKLNDRIGIRLNIFELNDLKELMTEEEKKEYSQIDDSVMYVHLKKKSRNDEDIKRNFSFLKKVMKEFSERTTKTQQKKAQAIINGEISLEELGFSDEIIEAFELEIDKLDLSPRAFKNLQKGGYSTVGDILKANEYDLLRIWNMGQKSVKEIMKKIEPYRVLFKDISTEQMGLLTEIIEQRKILRQEEESQEIDYQAIPIEELDLSVRAYFCLKSHGHYNTIGELLNLSEDDLLKIKNLGRRCTEEIMEKIEPYRMLFEDISREQMDLLTRIVEQRKILRQEETTKAQQAENKKKEQAIINGEISIEELGFSDEIIEAFELEIDKLDLSVRGACSYLRHGGYNTVGDILKADENDLLRIEHIGPKTVKEIMEKIEPYRVLFKDISREQMDLLTRIVEQRKILRQEEIIKTHQEENKKKAQIIKAIINGEISIEELGFGDEIIETFELEVSKLGLSTRALKCLQSSGYSTLGDILKANENVLLGIWNMRQKSVKEIMEKIEPYRVLFKDISREQMDLLTEIIEQRKLLRQEKEPKVQQEDKIQIITEENDSVETIMEDKGKVFFEDEEDDFWEDEELEPETLEEEKPIAEKKQKSTDLQLLKTKRDELQERISQLKSQMDKAQALLDECNEILGEKEEDKKTNLDD